MNHINNTDLTLSYYQFGPIIANYKLSKEFTLELKNRGSKTTIDTRHTLAGHIDKENSFSKIDKEWFLKQTFNVFQTYLNLIKERSLEKTRTPTSLQLNNLWINFMKKGEFNPPHHHDGDISFVIYTSVPKEIISEHREFKGRGPGPGTIQFIYGEYSEAYKTELNFQPEEGNMYLFPASLRHFVPPFRSDVIRESISGNLYFK